MSLRENATISEKSLENQIDYSKRIRHETRGIFIKYYTQDGRPGFMKSAVAELEIEGKKFWGVYNLMEGNWNVPEVLQFILERKEKYGFTEGFIGKHIFGKPSWEDNATKSVGIWLHSNEKLAEPQRIHDLSNKELNDYRQFRDNEKNKNGYNKK